jgi:putative (di)nucleoside polyphosphate hydrolase
MTLDPNTLPYRRNVGVMVINRAGLVWVGRRVSTDLKDDPKTRALAEGWWQMPQGGLDDGEDAAAAALRELAEETGMQSAEIVAEAKAWRPYELPPALLGKVLGGKYRGQTQKWFLLRFLGDDKEINLTPDGQEPEFDAWRWAGLDELPALIVPFKRDVYLSVIDEFRPFVRPL